MKMEIKMSKMEYQFDGEGNTTGISAGYQNYAGGENFNSTIIVTGTSDELDAMGKKDVDLKARIVVARLLGDEALQAALAEITTEAAKATAPTGNVMPDTPAK